jgi:hypothetical protein
VQTDLISDSLHASLPPSLAWVDREICGNYHSLLPTLHLSCIHKFHNQHRINISEINYVYEPSLWLTNASTPKVQYHIKYLDLHFHDYTDLLFGLRYMEKARNEYAPVGNER